MKTLKTFEDIFSKQTTMAEKFKKDLVQIKKEVINSINDVLSKEHRDIIFDYDGIQLERVYKSMDNREDYLRLMDESDIPKNSLNLYTTNSLIELLEYLENWD